MPSTLVLNCSQKIAELGLTIAFVESATAGRLSAEFSLTPHSGQILTGGLVCYDACIKENVLTISAEFIDHYSPESAEVTEMLACRFRSFMPADIHVAVTGLTTPGGSESPSKPVGTMFTHIYVKEKSITCRFLFQGTAEEIVLQTIDRIAEIIGKELDHLFA